MSIMEIEAVFYELTDTPLGKGGPSACEPNPEYQVPLSKGSEVLRGCRSKRVKSVMS